MVLGLTLAEIALLLVFVLLMLLATGFARRDKIIESFRGMVPISAAQLATMQEGEATLHQVHEAFNVPEETPPDDFMTLVKAAAAQTNFSQVAAALAEAAQQKKLAQERLERLAKVMGNDQDPEKAAKALSAQADQIANMQGQVKQLQKQLQNAGAGRVLPSCWTAPDGHIEFLFDVVLTSIGIKVREREQPHREAERDRLPVAKMNPEVTLEPAQFLALTNEVYQLSLQDNCRFYVVVFDSTGVAEKDLYKKLLETVEGHFYKTNSRDAAPF